MKNTAYLVCLAVMMLATKVGMAEDDAQVLPKFTISKKTTLVTEPLTKEGYPDYSNALNKMLSQGVTAENNANVLFWQSHGPHPEGATMPVEFFELMGMESPAEDGHYFVNLHSYLTDKGVAPEAIETYYDQQQIAMNKPWKAVDHPEIAAWLKVNEEPLATLAEGTKRSKYFSPMVLTEEEKKTGGMVSVLLPAVQSSRGFARALAARAMLNVGEGNSKQAWQDLLTCHRLGRHVAHGPTLIEGLVGIAIEGVALHTDLVFLEHTIPMRSEIAKYQRDFKELPRLPDMADKIDVGERFMFLDSTLLIARGGAKMFGALAGDGNAGAFANGLLTKFIETGIDYDVVLKMGNEWYDRLVTAMREPTHQKRTKAIAELNRELKKISSEVKDPLRLAKLLVAKDLDEKTGRLFGALMIALMLPAVEAVQTAEDRTVQQTRNMHLALAMLGYHTDQGRYPAKLDDLSPKYLGKVPDDLFTNKPLVYRLTDNGYLLYSFGVNGQDDGGNYYDDKPQGDDLRVRVPSLDN